MSARVRALVSVERPVVIIVDDAVSPSEEYVELEFETQEDANAAGRAAQRDYEEGQGDRVQKAG